VLALGAASFLTPGGVLHCRETERFAAALE